jgi:soluble lytic murein transglycosylase-like protein
VTLAKLWRRTPAMIMADDAANKLAAHYAKLGDLRHAGEVHASIAVRTKTPDVAAAARWNAATARLAVGDLPGALYAARNITIHHPNSKVAAQADAFVRAVEGIDAQAPLRLSFEERLERTEALLASQDPQNAIEELDAMKPNAPASLMPAIELQRGIALHRLRRYEDSNKVLEPLTSGPYKYAIPALSYASRNYTIVSTAINPTVYKTIKEKKRVGTIKKRVGKGKKKRIVSTPKFATVSRQIKLIDLAKKNKKDEYERLGTERLKDILQLPAADEATRLQVLESLVAKAQAKDQSGYMQELVPQIVKLDPLADPALQFFWNRAWAAYTRGDLASSRKLFRFIADTYTNPNIKRQSDYWYARTIERQGEKGNAQAIYAKLAAAPYADVYALYSAERGAKRTDVKTNPLESKEAPDWGELAEKNMPRELRLAYELTALSSLRDAYNEARRNMTRKNARYAEALLSEYYHSAGQLIPMYRSLRRAWPQLATPEQDTVPAYFVRMYYPLRYQDEIKEYAGKMKLDPNLVQALILQESYYNPKARSPVGATGLMQLMPPTAQDHARALGIRTSTSRLETPEHNIQLGTFHLRMLINMFRGNTHLAVASYNAGQGNVLKWRRANPGKPLDEFLESIPFAETRGYVKRVAMLKASYERLSPM